MAKRFRKSRTVAQREYRQRLARYEEYKATTLDPKSYKEWNASYRERSFYKREYKIYKERFKQRKERSRFGFRLTNEGKEVEMLSYKEFRTQYPTKRNTLEEEVEMGERDKIGSVVNEIINDQAYELSSPKARGIANYLLREERELLIQKKLVIPTGQFDDEGKEIDIIRRKNLELIIRQGQFVAEEVGLWDKIKELYHWLRSEAGGDLSAEEAKKQIGYSYFDSK